MNISLQPVAQWLPRLNFYGVAILLITLMAWLLSYQEMAAMSPMPGTMNMSLLAFIWMWAVMMAGMMLPSVMPHILHHTETWRDWLGFVTGYLGVWTLLGVGGYYLVWWTGRLAFWYAPIAEWAAIITLLLCGLYQFTPAKRRCLKQCEPHAHPNTDETTLWRSLVAGVKHSLPCLGTCGLLMTLMVVFSVMNLTAMLLLTLAITTEKLWTQQPLIPKAVGVACLVLAVTVYFIPGLAGGLVFSDSCSTYTALFS